MDLYYWKFLLQPIITMYSVTVSLFLYFVVSFHEFFSEKYNFLQSYSIRLNFEQTKRTRQLSISICFYIQLLILCDVGKIVDDAVTIVSFNNSFPFNIFPLDFQYLSEQCDLGCAGPIPTLFATNE